MAKLKGLGKGLDALFGVTSVPINNLSEHSEIQLKELELSRIKPGKYQPRIHFDENELQELATSIKQNGVIQPIVVRKLLSHYELIAGERRWRAAKLAGLEKIPAVIRDITDEESLAIGLIENIQRKDLNIIEESRGYKRLVDEFGLKHEDLAKITGKSRSHITNILRLLHLAKAVQELLVHGEIDMGHARALLSLSEGKQLEVAQKVIQMRMTTGELEKYVASLMDNNLDASMKVITRAIEPDIVSLEDKLSDKLGMVVRIRHGRKGSGKVIVNYSSLDELDNLLMCLK